MASSGRLRRFLGIALLAAVYFAAAKLGLRLAVVNPSATAVWPPTGIAIGALLRFGIGLWPGVFAGAFVANWTTAGGPWVALGIATGNTLEALLAAALVARFAGGAAAFERPATAFRFALLAAILPPAVSASLGVATLSAFRHVTAGHAGAVWLTWWLGDVSGAMVVTPFLLAWSRPVPAVQPPRSWREIAALYLAAAGTAWVVFHGASPLARRHYPLEFLLFPAFAWSAFRVDVRAAASVVAITMVIAIAGTVRGAGPFATGPPNDALLLLQSFVAITGLMVIAAAASATERKGALQGLNELSSDLERRVARRTEELSRANADLHAEIERRTRAQAELALSESRLREAQAVAHIGSWEYDVARDRVWWSDELYAIFGLAPGTPLTYEIYLSHLHPDDREPTRRVVGAAIASGARYEFEHRIVRPDGRTVFVRGRGRVVPGDDGTPAYLSGTAQDITDSKRAEQQHDRLVHEHAARVEAEESNRLKDEFLATLSHELRTPLNAIVGWVRLLEGGRLSPDDARRAVTIIGRNSELQTRLIADILDVSRMAVGRLDLTVMPLDLAAVANLAVDAMRPTAAAGGVHLETVFTGPAPVDGDAHRLQQVIGNLLSNALKFTPAGGTVTVRALDTGADVVLRVEDTGPGIDPGFLPHVFERFRQRDSSSTRRHGGLGLGLAIARHIAQIHGGTIAAANRPQGGAALTVTLPRASWSPFDGAAAAPPALLAAQPHAAGDALRGVRVLMVDDDADARELIAAVLGGCGAEVETAASVHDALAAIDRRVPDVVLSDIAMPIANGFDLISRLRTLPSERGGNLRAIAMTAYAGEEYERRTLEAGFDAYIAKPIDPDELVGMVRGNGGDGAR